MADLTLTPSPSVPSYDGPGLASLVPALMAPAGRRPGWLPAPLAGARQVVLLVLDGLGWGQLQARGDLAPTLAGLAGGPITSVAPTTTATALTSIATGQSPAEHGVVGYRLLLPGPEGPEVVNMLRWRGRSGDARPWAVPTEVQRGTPFAGRPVPIVSRSDFGGSGFSLAHLRGTRLVGWSVPSSVPVDVAAALLAGESFVYAYYEGVDKVAHASGLDAHYDAELHYADQLVAALLEVLPPGAALAVTADHGQVQVGARARPLERDLVEAAGAISGEARFVWLHLEPDRVDDVLAAARGYYHEEAWVVTVDEVEALGWLGGRLDDAVRARLGQVAIVAHQPVGYLGPYESGEYLLACRHGSLTADEMLVPLLAGAS